MNNERRAGLVKGTLDLLVMKALSRGSKHGYGIALWLERLSDGRLTVEDSAIYQALHRLQWRRLVDAEWGKSENNRRARFYKLTSTGKHQLKEETETWRDYVDSVSAILALDQ